jgi:hypothetical protein
LARSLALVRAGGGRAVWGLNIIFFFIRCGVQRFFVVPICAKFSTGGLLAGQGTTFFRWGVQRLGRFLFVGLFAVLAFFACFFFA